MAKKELLCLRIQEWCIMNFLTLISKIASKFIYHQPVFSGIGLNFY